MNRQECRTKRIDSVCGVAWIPLCAGSACETSSPPANFFCTAEDAYVNERAGHMWFSTRLPFTYKGLASPGMEVTHPPKHAYIYIYIYMYIYEERQSQENERQSFWDCLSSYIYIYACLGGCVTSTPPAIIFLMKYLFRFAISFQF